MEGIKLHLNIPFLKILSSGLKAPPPICPPLGNCFLFYLTTEIIAFPQLSFTRCPRFSNWKLPGSTNKLHWKCCQRGRKSSRNADIPVCVPVYRYTNTFTGIPILPPYTGIKFCHTVGYPSCAVCGNQGIKFSVKIICDPRIRIRIQMNRIRNTQCFDEYIGCAGSVCLFRAGSSVYTGSI